AGLLLEARSTQGVDGCSAAAEAEHGERGDSEDTRPALFRHGVASSAPTREGGACAARWTRGQRSGGGCSPDHIDRYLVGTADRRETEEEDQDPRMGSQCRSGWTRESVNRERLTPK